MPFVKVYGQSDDLIEVEGNIYEEFNPDSSDAPSYLAFSDGTVLSIEYSSTWTIKRVIEGTATFTKTDATGPDDDYTDRVKLEGDIRWCVFGSKLVKAVVVPRES